MTLSKIGPRTVRARVARFGRDGRGVAAIEFAMIVPIMIMLFLGSIEFSQALTVDRRVTQVASSAADLIAQYDKISASTVDNHLRLMDTLLTPYPTAPLRLSVTSIQKINLAPATVQWNRQHPDHGGQVYSGTYSAAVPAGLLSSTATGGTTCVVMAEVSYSFTPTIGKFLTSAVNLSEKFYLKPRKSTCVQLI
jgi:Flp pilus assembly protein TadG